MNMPQDDKDASIDGQLELKKRARRRLVGAAALALLAAVVLPMVMDGEPRQLAHDVQVKIPGQDTGGFASRVMPNKAVVTPLPPAEPESKPEPKPEPKSEPKPEAKSEPKPEVKPEPKPAPAKAEEVSAQAALNGVEVAAQWIVQLGAYKEEDRVKVLLAKLKQMNIAAYTEPVDTPQGVRTRVRAGPFKSREAAEQAQVKIRRIGVDGPVAQKQ